MKNTINLSLPDGTSTSFYVEGEPHSEKDLLAYPEYVKWYWEVGLGAPVTANVKAYKGLKKQEYTFSYEVKGNSISNDEFLTLLAKYKQNVVHMHTNAEERVTQLLIQFDSRDAAVNLCNTLDKIANVGSYGGYDSSIKKYIVQIEYHML